MKKRGRSATPECAALGICAVAAPPRSREAGLVRHESEPLRTAAQPDDVVTGREGDRAHIGTQIPREVFPVLSRARPSVFMKP